MVFNLKIFCSEKNLIVWAILLQEDQTLKLCWRCYSRWSTSPASFVLKRSVDKPNKIEKGLASIVAASGDNTERDENPNLELHVCFFSC